MAGRTLDAQDFAAANLTVHGLWPNDGPTSGPTYCDVDAATKALDEPQSWCELPKPKVTEQTMAGLAPAMPGVASCSSTPSPASPSWRAGSMRCPAAATNPLRSAAPPTGPEHEHLRQP